MSQCVRLPSCPNLYEIQSRICSGLYSLLVSAVSRAYRRLTRSPFDHC
jgi:hypothetical protein